MSWSLLQRPVLFSMAAAAVLLAIALVLLVGKSWRSVQLLQPLQTHADMLDRLQGAGYRAQFVLIGSLQDRVTVSADQLGTLRTEIAQVRTLRGYLIPETAQRLDQAERALGESQVDPERALGDSLSALRVAIEAEAAAHNALLTNWRRTADAELWLAAIAAAVVTALAAGIALFLRWRVALPLGALGRLMSELSERRYGQASTRGIDPLLLPLFDRYNAMSSRLAELEAHQQDYQARLEHDVRAATTALLAQQQSFGDAQRLAAVGELALSLAHELRNPLAGIQAAIDNLQIELGADAELEKRLALIGAEVKRVTRLLNELLGQARQPPEPLQPVALRATVDEILDLLRYQMPTTLQLENVIDADLVCPLPPDRFRQAVLNLLLNAAAAASVADRPGRVRVSATRQPHTVTLSVSDDGRGFPPAMLADGTRAFASQREGGSGLGLAVVRRFSDDVHGELRISNPPAGGACIELLLPQASHEERR